jgi:hypothetical protein
MRIAWIDYTLSTSGFLTLLLEEKGLELFGETCWELFEQRHGRVDNYQGLLIHSGLTNQARDIPRIRELQRKNMPCALITNSPTDYEFSSDVPIFSYNSIDGIVQYFKRGKE